MTEPIHALVYGDPGGGKSTFAATWPTPMLVLTHDPAGKETPYLRRATCTETRDEFGIRVVTAMHADEQRIVVEYYNDLSPTSRSWEYMRWRVQQRAFVDQGYATLVIDSVTFLELAIRKYAAATSKNRDPRSWFADSTEGLEDVLLVQLAGVPINVVVCAHVDTQRDELHGTFLRQVAAPGRLTSRNMLAAAYAELYRAYVIGTGEKTHYLLQTHRDENFNAASQIGAPNPCEQRYEALWPSKGANNALIEDPSLSIRVP